MNGNAWSYEDAARHAKTSNPPQPHRQVMPSYTSPRNVSGPLAVDTAVSPEQNTNPSPWHRANPHAAPQNNSKTSQYIDKITSENERLRRELKAEKLAREDEAKRVSAARSKAEDSRAEYQHLQVLADANARAIERKDRKLEELKATLEAEVKRRQAAEQRAEEALKMLGDTRSETQRQLASAYEMKHLAETNADAARDGFKRITDSYDKQVKAMKDELKELRIQRREDADKIQRQGIVSDQLHHEMARRLRNEDVMTDMMGKYKREHKKELNALVNEAGRMRASLPSKEKEATNLVRELADTRDKMKWVMAQKQRLNPN
jgi:chromosome segregation ATPase